jgi:hypothetical protein
MKQLTESKLAEMLKAAYLEGFEHGFAEVAEDADHEDLVDLEALDTQITAWVDAV